MNQAVPLLVSHCEIGTTSNRKLANSNSLIKMHSQGMFDILITREDPQQNKRDMDDSYTYSIDVEDTVIRLTTSGNFDYLRALQMWREVIAACKEANCFKILTISNVTNPLPTAEVFNSSDFFTSAGLDNRFKLAVVTENPDVHESHQVAATALKTKGSFAASAFSREKEARRWLEE
jgi:hypothetical protein